MSAATKGRGTKRGTDKPKADPYQLVTDRIVEALEAGHVPWHQPWRNGVGGYTGPRSLSTRKPYEGVNVFVLWATAMSRGYESNWWGTYNRIKEMGGTVRKGEKGTPVVFWRVIEVKDKDATDPTAKRKIPLLKFFYVFNADQADDLTVPEPEAVPEFDPIEACESIWDGWTTRPEMSHGGDRAFYSPQFDRIQMPIQGAFTTPAHYYGTLFHEGVHATGHESRLNRRGDAPQPFGSPAYGLEELVAEMGAAFLCGEGGIEVNVQHHASYIASWLKVLKDDPKMVVHAGGAAAKATNLILGRDRAAEEGGEHDA